jgi:ribosomal protein S12 methylthiotransferase accessory factor
VKITFPGGARVNADYRGFTIKTDQPERFGGDGTAPAPFDYFLASIGTCAGFYAHNFLTQRNLSTEGLELSLNATTDPDTRMVSGVELEVTLPEDFPKKYERAIVNAINLCSVKKHLLTPPAFSTTLARRFGKPVEAAGRPEKI